MANTYTQIYTHIVFAVQGRQNRLRCAGSNSREKLTLLCLGSRSEAATPLFVSKRLDWIQ